MSRTRPPKAVRSILYIHWKLRYYPSNNPMNYLATNVTKKLDHNKGKDGSGSSTGEENVIESIKVNGVVQTVADDKSVDITVPTVDVNKNYVDTELTKKANVSDIPSLEGYVTDEELNAKGYLTSHQDISGKVDKVKGKSLIADTEIERLKSVKNYDDTEIKAELAKKANSTDVTKEISDKIAEVVSDAPESFNTLKEISDWIAGHEDDASAMNSAISDNKTAITALQTGKADKNEIPTTVAELTDSADYAKKTDIPITLPADGGNSDTVNNHTVKSDVPENAKFTDTTYSDATQIEHGLMSVDDKKKLDGLKKYTPDGSTITADEDGTLHGVAKITVDTALSSTSTNPVQNKVVKAYVDKKVSENVDFSTSTSKTLNDTVEAPLMIGNATRNLLNPTLQTTTQNGVTCTNNGDGTYTLNGTATAGVVLYIAGSPTKNAVGGYKLLGCPINGSNDTYRIVVSYYDNESWQAEGRDTGNGVIIDGTYPKLNYLIKVESGTTLTNIVFKPMLTTDLNATYDDFVPYTESTAHIDSSTEFPLLGLKSFDGETNIISPGNVEVTYAKSDSGAAILDMSENKLDKDDIVNNQTTTVEGYALDARQANPNIDGTLAKQISDLNGKASIVSDVRKETTVNLLKPTLQTSTSNGITCTNNGDGTYAFNGTATGIATFIVQMIESISEKHLNENLWLVGCPKNSSTVAYSLQLWIKDHGTISDIGDGIKVHIEKGARGNIGIVFNEGTQVNNLVFKPMLTTNLNATYDDFVQYTGDSGSLNWDVASLLKRIETLESLVNKADTTVTE